MPAQEKKWYAVYTKPRWEKKVAERLAEKGIDNYLPMIKTLKQWSDRKKWVQEPLFKSYIFVNISEEEYLPSLQTPGVVRYVTIGRERISIPPVQIEAVRQFIESGDDFLIDSPALNVGDRVIVRRGPLTGLEGTLIEFHQKHRVRIIIDGIQQSLHIKVPGSFLEKLSR